MSKKRLTTLIIFSVAIVLMVVLAASLGKLQLKGGEAFQMQNGTLALGGAGITMNPNLLALIVRIVTLCAILLIPLEIYFLITSKEARKRLIRDIIALLILVVLVRLLVRNNGNSVLTPIQPLAPDAASTTTSSDTASIAAVPDWVVLVSRLIIAFLVAAFVFIVGWVILKRRNQAPTAMDQLAETARNALDSLRNGGDLEDVVIRCYIQMSHILRTERSIQRSAALTPHEFEEQLIERGFPSEPVHNLTRLFEDVRYGHEMVGPAEEQRAIGSLDAIIAACKLSKTA
jgi:hypothetical protein